MQQILFYEAKIPDSQLAVIWTLFGLSYEGEV